MLLLVSPLFGLFPPKRHVPSALRHLAQVWTPSCLPSTLTTLTWTVAWVEAGEAQCPTSSRSPRRASAACGKSRLRASAACWERSVPPPLWYRASPPEWTKPRTPYPFYPAAPLLVRNRNTALLEDLSCISLAFVFNEYGSQLPVKLIKQLIMISTCYFQWLPGRF